MSTIKDYQDFRTKVASLLQFLHTHFFHEKYANEIFLTSIDINYRDSTGQNTFVDTYQQWLAENFVPVPGTNGLPASTPRQITSQYLVRKNELPKVLYYRKTKGSTPSLSNNFSFLYEDGLIKDYHNETLSNWKLPQGVYFRITYETTVDDLLVGAYQYGENEVDKANPAAPISITQGIKLLKLALNEENSSKLNDLLHQPTTYFVETCIEYFKENEQDRLEAMDNVAWCQPPLLPLWGYLLLKQPKLFNRVQQHLSFTGHNIAEMSLNLMWGYLARSDIEHHQLLQYMSDADILILSPFVESQELNRRLTRGLQLSPAAIEAFSNFCLSHEDFEIQPLLLQTLYDISPTEQAIEWLYQRYGNDIENFFNQGFSDKLMMEFIKYEAALIGTHTEANQHWLALFTPIFTRNLLINHKDEIYDFVKDKMDFVIFGLSENYFNIEFLKEKVCSTEVKSTIRQQDLQKRLPVANSKSRSVRKI